MKGVEMPDSANPLHRLLRGVVLPALLLMAGGVMAGGVMAAVPGAAPVPAAQAKPAASPLVLTATQATYSLTSALVEGTPIAVRNVPEDARQFTLLKDYIQRRTEELAPLFKSATAVVGLTNALPADPLYRFARQANVRVVNIDAAIPWQLDMPGVALTPAPRTDADWAGETEAAGEAAIAPCFWLSISNSVRMADIIAHDLSALFPESAAAIGGNLAALRRSLLAERDQYQQRMLAGAGAADVVFALTGDFVYLTNDLGLFVDGYFIKQDLDWTPADLAALTQHLRQQGIKVVLHRWQPSAAIQKAITDGGARLVVLDAADPGLVKDRQLAVDGLQQILHNNLQALQSGLMKP